MDKDGNEIKWPEGRHHGTFFMSDASYNEYWSITDQKIFKVSHYLAGASIALQALFTAFKQYISRYKEFKGFNREFILIPFQILAFFHIKIKVDEVMRKEYHKPACWAALAFLDLFYLTMIISLLPTYFQSKHHSETRPQISNNF